MTPTERRRKATAVTLLAAMAAVAVALWQWPSGAPKPARLVAVDVILPVIMPLPSTPPVSKGRPVARVETPASRVAGSRSHSIERHAPMLLARADVAAHEAQPLLLASHPLPQPAAPIASHPVRTPLDAAMPLAGTGVAIQADGAGHAFARAGIAFGDAFRRAGVNVGAAFSRIF